jgi:hypothetical protein
MLIAASDRLFGAILTPSGEDCITGLDGAQYEKIFICALMQFLALLVLKVPEGQHTSPLSCRAGAILIAFTYTTFDAARQIGW